MGKKVSQFTEMKKLGGSYSGKLLHTDLNKFQNITLKVVPKKYQGVHLHRKKQDGPHQG